MSDNELHTSAQIEAQAEAAIQVETIVYESAELTTLELPVNFQPIGSEGFDFSDITLPDPMNTVAGDALSQTQQQEPPSVPEVTFDYESSEDDVQEPKHTKKGKNKNKNRKAHRVDEPHVLNGEEAVHAAGELKRHFQEAPPKKVAALFRSADLLGDMMKQRGMDVWQPPKEGVDFINFSSRSATPMGRVFDIYSPFKAFNPSTDKVEITPVTIPNLGNFVTVAGILYAIAGVYRSDDTAALSDETQHELHTSYAGPLNGVTYGLRLVEMPGLKRVMCDVLWLVLKSNPVMANMLKESGGIQLRSFYVNDQGVEKSSIHEAWLVELYSICRVYLQNDVEDPEFTIGVDEPLLPAPRQSYSKRQGYRGNRSRD